MAAGFGLVAYSAYVTAQLLVSQLVGKEVQPLQNRQAGLDQGNELLVEYEELLEVDGLPPLRDSAESCAQILGTDRINKKALLRQAVTSFPFAGSVGNLFMHLAACVRVPQEELSHC